MSEGRRLLVLWLGGEGRSQRALARRCGVAWGAIGALASGAHRVPSLGLAHALERIAGIATETWLVEAGGLQVLTEESAEPVRVNASKPPTAA